VLIWTAYSRLKQRVIAFLIAPHTASGLKMAQNIYKKVKEIRPNVSFIYTDANSCYDVAFAMMNIHEQHMMTKTETHLIESSNSVVRDNLARFNRKTKRYSKSEERLCQILTLFFYFHRTPLAT